MDTLQIGTMQGSYIPKTSKLNKRVSDDDALMSKEAFFAKIDRAKKGIEDGKGKMFHTKEELLAYFDSL